MIVATAGHVDHGKSALVRALTGVDPDRLPEEKARGMTLDLGFAYRRRRDGGLLGIVDVPGHERFVATMIAGACGVGAALLVVAADDGPMPQTREHVAILDLLGIATGIVALTKIDRVDGERRDSVAAQIAGMLVGTTLAGAPIVATSTVTGDGLAELAARLETLAAEHRGPPPQGRFRMAVDRCFTLHGVGVIASGAVFNGALAAGDPVMVAPSGLAGRARALRIHDGAVSRVAAGERCAVALAGIERTALHRGDWLVAPRSTVETRRLDVGLRLLPEVVLRDEAAVQLHLGAAAIPCRVRRHEDGRAQLVLGRPTAAIAGDRFVLRDPASRRTLGGGRVLDPLPPARSGNKAARRAWLAALDAPDAAGAFAALAAQAAQGLDLDWFAAAFNLTAEEERGLSAQAKLTVCDTGSRRIGFAPHHWRALVDGIAGALAACHRDHPERQGLAEVTLRTAAAPRLQPAAFRQALAGLVAQGQVVRSGVWLHRPGHHAAASAADLALWQRVEPALTESGLRPPRVVELAALTGGEPGAIEAFLVRAAERGWLERVAPNRFYLPGVLEQLRAVAARLAARSSDGSFAAGEFSRATSIGRNLTIEVLEHFDRGGFTRRAGDRRRLAGPYGPTSMSSR